MSGWSPVNELRRRVAAIDRYNADGQADHRELAPILIGLLDWMSEHPEASGEFETVFLDVVEDNLDQAGRSSLPPELLEFCLHTLRYPRVRERLEEIRDRADDTPRGYNTRRWAEHILEAYQDDWEAIRIGLWPPYAGPNAR